MKQLIYLDNAATTPVHRDVADEVTECFTSNFGNPSSLHRLGIEAEKRVRQARLRVASLLNAQPEEIIFTSGGTESNNLAILGSVFKRERHGRHCITTEIEHPSVLNTFEYLKRIGWEISYLPVDKHGLIDLNDLEKLLRPDTVLVSIMHVNNEVGSIQPVDKIGKLLMDKPNKPLFHVDAVQSFGKLDIDVKEWNIDLLSVSGHKIHAPKGIGALYIRKGIHIQPLQWGGGQEKGLRSGTENVPGIVGLGKAAELAKEYMGKDEKKLYRLKAALVKGIKEYIPEAVINGPGLDAGAPHILNVSFPGIRAEVLLHALEDRGIFVSTGSACSSRKNATSHVLGAMKLKKELVQSSIRISLSYMNTEEEINVVPHLLKECVKQLKYFMRR